jgi:hypothetical protein
MAAKIKSSQPPEGKYGVKARGDLDRKGRK